MGYVACSFYAENEPRRRIVIPVLKTLRFLEGVKGSIYLYGRQCPGSILKLTVLRKAGRIKDSAPRWIPPAGNSDEGRAHRYSLRPRGSSSPSSVYAGGI